MIRVACVTLWLATAAGAAVPESTSAAAAMTDSAAAPAVPESTSAAAADSLTAQLDRLAAQRRRLTGPDQRVFDELIAAAREMADDGDPDAARLILADARLWIDKQGR